MIRIQNIYYMLAYAFRVLTEKKYASCATEEFENTADLLAAILVKGISAQIKRGLSRDYIEETESLSCLRGKIDISESIKKQTLIKQQLVCIYDEFSVDSYHNRILKTTAELLLKNDIPKERKKELRNLMLYFQDVGTLDPFTINWKTSYNRNNQTYRMLISICYLVIKGLLQTTTEGSAKLMDFLDDQKMHRLFEKFILEYYRKEFPHVKVSAPRIAWALDDDIDVMLPAMETDSVLSYEGRVLIIDAKYYTHTMQTQYEALKLRSNHLYQIFAYVKNRAAIGGEVSGLLLYAKTDEKLQPNFTYKMSGNTVSARSLNLDCDFSEVVEQLDDIADSFLGTTKSVIIQKGFSI